MKPLILTLFLFQSFVLSACDRWQHIFGGDDYDAVSKIIKTNSGGWITAGYTKSYGDLGYNILILKWNEEGKVVWERVIGNKGDEYGYAIAQDTTGNIFVCGKTNSTGTVGGFDMCLLKLDSTGTLLWQHTYGGSGDDFANSMLLDSTGDIIMAGGTTSFGNGGNDVYLVKVNSSGTMLWSKTYGKSGDELAYGLAQVKDSGYILAGVTTSYLNNKGYVIRTDNIGDSLWSNAYYIGAISNAAIYDVKVLADTEFIYTGYGGSSNYGNMFHMKTNMSGNLSYIHLASNLSDAGNAILTTSDGGYVVGGSYSNFGSFPILSKFSSSGIMQWQHIYTYNLGLTYNLFAVATDIVQNADDSFTLCGFSSLNSTCTSYSDGVDGYILKTDSLGLTVPVLSQSITANPGASFCNSANVNVTLLAPSGYESYQWFRMNSCTEKIKGANTQSYSTASTGVYFCLLISSESIYYSNKITVSVTTINNPPVITPSGIANRCNVAIPNDAMLSTPYVDGLNYQWQLNGVAIIGATNYRYFPVVNGMYSVTVSNNCDSMTSAQTEMHINQGPQNILITASGPTNECRQCGQNTNLISSETNSHYNYTWLLNNSPIPGTNNSYIFTPVLSGNYSLIVSNACGIDTSNNITVLVNSNSVPVITSTGNSNLTSFSDSVNTFYCGTDTLNCSILLNCGNYEWEMNGNIMPGISNRYLAKQPGIYTVKLTDSCGTSVQSLPFIVNAIQGYDSILVTNNNSCDYAVLIAPSSTNSNSYHWYRNGVALSNTTSLLNTTAGGSYSCTFHPAICPTTISTKSVTINPSLGYVAITASPSISVCSGSILLNVNAANANYVWKKNGIVISGANSQAYTATQTASYTCIVSRPGCVLDSAYLNVSIGTNQISTNHLIICQNTNTILGLLVPDNSSSFQWRRNGIDLVGDTFNNISVNQTGIYDLRITGSCGTHLTNTLTISSPNTTLSPSGTIHLCDGTFLTFNAPFVSGYKYKWQYGTFMLQDTGSTISFSTNNFCCGTQYLRAYITIPGVCSYYTSFDTIVPQHFLSNNIYSSTSPEWCGVGSVQLNSRTDSVLNYQWYKNSIAIPSATSSVYFASSNGNYYVSIADSIGCGKNSNSITVRNDLLSGTISSAACQTLCSGDTAQLTLIPPTNTYQWHFNGDSISGDTTQNHQAVFSGTYSVSFSNSTGCSGTASTRISIASAVSNTIIYPSQFFCTGDTALLRSSSFTNAYWYFNGIAITTPTYFQCAATQSGLYSEIGYQNGCPVYSDTVALNFNSTPYANITTTQTSLCNVTSITLLANYSSNNLYQWKKNGVDLSGANFVNYNTSSAGVYTCEVTGICGTTLSNAITITSSFNANQSVIGATTFCSGDSALLQAMPSSGGYTYQWKNNYLNIPGSNNNAYWVKTSGNYFVEISDTNGCINASNIISINVLPQSPSPNLTSSSGYICPGKNSLLSVDSTNILSYQWKHNGVNLSNATFSVYHATLPGLYTCGVTNTCGTGISDSVFLTVGSIPAITNLPDTTLCTGTFIDLHAGWVIQYTYLWQDSSTSELLTLTSLLPDSHLVYVLVTNLSGCMNSDTSLINFEICNSTTSINENDHFNIYPNPVFDKLMIDVPFVKYFQLKILDITGRAIFLEDAFEDTFKKQIEVNTSLLAGGLYFLQINTYSGSFLKIFVKK